MAPFLHARRKDTVHRWMTDDPAFIAEYNRARLEMHEAVGQALRGLAFEAVRTLRAVLGDPGAPHALRLKAAAEVLKLTAEAPVGPTDERDARVEIAGRERKRMIAGLGMG